MSDLIIIGAGAAGLTASIYASRYKITHRVFGPVVGGQITEAHIINNYPGFESITGTELAEKFKKHAASYGVKIISDDVAHLEKAQTGFAVKTVSGQSYSSRALILAMGAKHRRLGVLGEEKLIGRGVSYCAACDAPLFKNKVVAVVGGGDSAVSAAVHLSKFAQKIYLVVRGQSLRAEPIWADQLNQSGKIEVLLETNIKEIKGETVVERASLDKPYRGQNGLKVDGVFIEIGLIPAVGLTKTLEVKLDEKGYIIAGPNGETNIKGVFAAGDLAAFPGMMNFRQIITSAAEGAIAAAGVYKFLQGQPPTPDWG